jgi:hypothetical protein
MRQYQTVECAGCHVDRSIGVGVFVGQHRLAQRPHGFGRPAPAHIADPPEPRFVLEHQRDRRALGPVPAEAADVFGEFFFQSCCAWTLCCGWCVSGARFRHPCRWSKLYTDDSAISRPSSASSSGLSSGTTNTPPLRARSRNGCKTSCSRSGVKFSRRRPPRAGIDPSPTRSPRIKALRNRQVQPTDRPIIFAVSARLSP